jgi:hypothetical protein
MPSHIGFESAIGKDCATWREVFWLIISVLWSRSKNWFTSKDEKMVFVHVFKTVGNASRELMATKHRLLPQVHKPTTAKTTLNWSILCWNEHQIMTKNGVISIILRTI